MTFAQKIDILKKLMDTELLIQRSNIISALREFFTQNNFLEVDTPALSQSLIPETCLEVFKTEYIEPWSEKKHDLFLVPSPEVYIKPLIAKHKLSVFQISKCYRNVESVGRTHSPEFTMLEYYKLGANYIDSLELTENLFYFLDKKFNLPQDLTPPFIKLSMNDAFYNHAGFYLSDCQTVKDLAQKTRSLDLFEPTDNPFESWTWEELYNLIFVQVVEPNLPKEKGVFLLDYPKAVSCLAQDVKNSEKNKNLPCKERWELYCRGIELANCYSEETKAQNIKEYFEEEGSLKSKSSLIPHAINEDYWKYFSETDGNTGFPKCSGTAMGVDRLIMLLCAKNSIDDVLPFTLK